MAEWRVSDGCVEPLGWCEQRHSWMKSCQCCDLQTRRLDSLSCQARYCTISTVLYRVTQNLSSSLLFESYLLINTTQKNILTVAITITSLYIYNFSLGVRRARFAEWRAASTFFRFFLFFTPKDRRWGRIIIRYARRFSRSRLESRRTLWMKSHSRRVPARSRFSINSLPQNDLPNAYIYIKRSLINKSFTKGERSTLLYVTL